jgi:endonuclease YncB( thermonuclease family)
MADQKPALGFLGGSGLPRLIVFGGVAGFALVGLWSKSGDILGSAWNNVVNAIGTPRVPSEVGGNIVGRASVIDGDTIDIRGTRIRFNGIDAPESKQSCRDRLGSQYACGRRAAFALSDKIGSRNLSCTVLDHDRYGRSVATCTLGSIDLNEWMVSSGWALAYRQYSTAYVGAEAQAEAAKAGIWDGEFTPPWEWRRSHDGAVRPTPVSADPSDASSSDQPGCTIKGNISSSGERIFHAPGQQNYAKTVISEGKGERWFCSEAEAIAAGWRAAKR